MDTSVEIQKRLLATAESYNNWIYRNIAPFIKNRILDVGCSIGNITKFLLNRDMVIGIDKSSEAIEIISQNFSAHKNFKALNMDVIDEKVPSLAAEGIDTILCLNLLEHIEDDVKALNNLHSTLSEDGRLIILVPVIEWLFGSMDKADNHFRRYSKSEINNKLARTNFYIEKQFYMNLLGIAGWYLNGKVFKNRVVPENHYSLYARLVPFIARIEGFIKPPIGLSLVTVCRKNK